MGPVSELPIEGMQIKVTVLFSSRGTDELLGLMDQVTIINSTLGKALGGAAGAASNQQDPFINQTHFYTFLEFSLIPI